MFEAPKPDARSFLLSVRPTAVIFLPLRLLANPVS